MIQVVAIDAGNTGSGQMNIGSLVLTANESIYIRLVIDRCFETRTREHVCLTGSLLQLIVTSRFAHRLIRSNCC